MTKAWRILRWTIDNPGNYISPTLIRRANHTNSAIMLGKRKRSASNTATILAEDSSSSSQEDLQEVFRRHFEAQFQPLPDQQPLVPSTPTISAELDPEANNSDWDGLSTDEEEAHIEVVEHITLSKAERAELSKEELKSFMVSSHHSVDDTSTTTDARS